MSEDLEDRRDSGESQLTDGHFPDSTSPRTIETAEGVNSHQYLNSTDGVEHMRVVPWSGAKAPIIILT